jgi:glyoxylase-like metal-dependent hydrolase (beta-lactamase superfamily II)
MFQLPSSIRVIVRGWLNCNQVALLDGAGHALIDSGYCTRADETLARLADDGALGSAPLARLVNTHCHSDHVGGNAALVERYGCRVSIPRSEAPAIDDWTRQERWNAYVDQQLPRFRYDDTLAPGDTFHAGGFEWEAHAAPGHDMDALMFFEPCHGILVTGDALWRDGLGFVWPHEGSNPFVEAALETLDRIEALAPRFVIPGHGAPFADAAAAVGRARSRLAAFGADPRKTARHMVKVMLVFALLQRGSMPSGGVGEYVRRIPVYADINARFLGENLEILAQRTVSELLAAGAIRLVDGAYLPTMPA